MKKAAVLLISFILLSVFAVSAFAEEEAIVKNEKLIPSESTEKSGFSDADFKELYTKAYYIGRMFTLLSGTPDMLTPGYTKGETAKTATVPENEKTLELTSEKTGKSFRYTAAGIEGLSEESIRAYMNTVFSENLTNWFFALETPQGLPFVVEKNGRIYYASYGAANEGTAEITRTLDEESKVVFRVTVTASKGAYSSEYVLEKENGNWRFTSFRLPYQILEENNALSGAAGAPQTGDSTVFLLPAAALSLGGVLLAAKKRKRTS